MTSLLQSHKRARDILVAILLAGAVSMLVLVVTGYLPERGFVTGTAYVDSKTFGTGLWRGPLAFHQVGTSRIFYTSTDSHGHYAKTLPQGSYHVVRDAYADCLSPDPNGQCIVQGFSLSAGEHLEANFTFINFDQ
jgi:hypothetical protein